MQDIMNKYKDLEFSLVSELTRLGEQAKELNVQDVVDTVTHEISRIKEKTFRVIVVGEFKRGKSTLINALLKRNVLPADIVPTTATINRVAYDPNPFVRLMFKDGTMQDIDINKLSDYVTKLTPEGEAIASKIEEAVVYYPTPFCQNNVYIIDTPGLCDDDTMTAVTMNALYTADAAIMVISALAPFSQTECDFITKLVLNSSSLCRLIFAVNYIDKIDCDEVDRLLDFAKKRIYSFVLAEAKQIYGQDTDEFKRTVHILDNAPVFGISSYQAINARINSDSKKLEQSRFEPFEQELESILATEQGLSSIRIPIEKMIISCDRMIDEIDSILYYSENKFKNGSGSDLQIEILQNEQNMMKFIESIKSKDQPLIKTIHDLSDSFLRELYQKGLCCFEKIGIHESNFQINVIASYFKYINSAMNKFQNIIFDSHSVTIQREIIKTFNDYIDCLDKNYNYIIEIAKQNNISVTGKLIHKEFVYWLEKHPFPLYDPTFMLPENMNMPSFTRERFRAFSNANSFRANIGMYWEKSINDSMDVYRNMLIQNVELIGQDLTNEYMNCYDNLLVQIRSGISGQLSFAKEKYADSTNYYERKKKIILEIRCNSSILLDKVNKKTMNFETK